MEQKRNEQAIDARNQFFIDLRHGVQANKQSPFAVLWPALQLAQYLQDHGALDYTFMYTPYTSTVMPIYEELPLSDYGDSSGPAPGPIKLAENEVINLERLVCVSLCEPVIYGIKVGIGHSSKHVMYGHETTEDYNGFWVDWARLVTSS